MKQETLATNSVGGVFEKTYSQVVSSYSYSVCIKEFVSSSVAERRAA